MKLTKLKKLIRETVRKELGGFRLSLVDILLDLRSSVDSAAAHKSVYAKEDPNFYADWLVHLQQELRTLQRIRDKKGVERAMMHAEKWHHGSGANPERSGHVHGDQYLDWVAELSGDASFPAKFRAAVKKSIAA